MISIRCTYEYNSSRLLFLDELLLAARLLRAPAVRQAWYTYGMIAIESRLPSDRVKTRAMPSGTRPMAVCCCVCSHALQMNNNSINNTAVIMVRSYPILPLVQARPLFLESFHFPPRSTNRYRRPARRQTMHH